MSNQQFLTGIFKLHNPTRWRRETINRVMTEYTLAMQGLLEYAQSNLDRIRRDGQDKRGKYTGNSITALLPSPKSAQMASALKDALKANVAAMLASYLELDNGDKQNAGYPVSRDPRPNAYNDALDQFTRCFLLNTPDTTKERAEAIENDYRAKLMLQARGSVMPINFCRSRDFTMLADARLQKFYVWLKLTENGDNQQGDITGGNLIDLATGEIFTKRKGSGVLFPLEIGQRGGNWAWQYTHFLKAINQGAASIQSGKLVKENGDYFLHVSFAFDCPESYEPETYLGIDRGVFYSMAYAIVGKAGEVVTMSHIKDGFRDERVQAGKRVQVKQQRGKVVTAKDYRQQNLDSVLHVLVNKMIDLAIEHKSMIVLEDLNIKIGGKFYRSAWKKIHKMFEYKCKLAGVPFKKEGVWAAYTSKLCINCGELAERSKRDGETPVVCHHCGFVGHADECAAVNIARRAMYRKADWGGTKDKPGDWRAFHRSFANQAGFETDFDLRMAQCGVQLALI